ncbi:MAG: hypothetical protein KKF46_07605 [Nanoarchaeota archaeon]|nr:hypothetical protein [Nanoarchaeota archaeon]MBU1322193.1 hypothetical protein [Nanoarchaeota archaeon]MBU1597734.1 hypothetical protein [Nanoarchaeota archaeon]
METQTQEQSEREGVGVAERIYLAMNLKSGFFSESGDIENSRTKRTVSTNKDFAETFQIEYNGDLVTASGKSVADYVARASLGSAIWIQNSARMGVASWGIRSDGIDRVLEIADEEIKKALVDKFLRIPHAPGKNIGEAMYSERARQLREKTSRFGKINPIYAFRLMKLYKQGLSAYHDRTHCNPARDDPPNTQDNEEMLEFGLKKVREYYSYLHGDVK